MFGWQTDPLTRSTWPTIVIAILAEVWKTTPFMALLLLAGLALVPDELHEAAKVDGASTWQRFWKITMPLMKPAILVALLFRTLDAFRIFDSIYIMSNTGQNRNIETVSILGYNQLLNRLNLGLGSAISVLIFICVALIAVVFIKGFGARDEPGEGTDMDRKIGRWVAADLVVLVFALFPVLWIISLSLKTPATVADGRLIPAEFSFDNYSGDLRPGRLHRRAAQLDRHRADLDGHRGRARVAGRLRDRAPGLPGQEPDPRWRAGDRDVPADLDRRGRSTTCGASIGLYDTWLGLIIPYLTFALPLAIYTLSAFFREIPWELEQAAQVDGATPFQAFRKVIVPLAAPGVFTRRSSCSSSPGTTSSSRSR